MVNIILGVVVGGIVASAQGLAAQDSARTAGPTSVRLPAPLERVLRDYERAWRGGDAAALAALYTEDGFALHADGAPTQGRAAIQHARGTAAGPLSLRAWAYAMNDSIAYIIGGFAARAGERDHGKFVLTLRRESDGRWRITGDIDNANERPRQRGTPRSVLKSCWPPDLRRNPVPAVELQTGNVIPARPD